MLGFDVAATPYKTVGEFGEAKLTKFVWTETSHFITAPNFHDLTEESSKHDNRELNIVARAMRAATGGNGLPCRDTNTHILLRIIILVSCPSRVTRDRYLSI
ncbi:hypothetical protein RRG08_046938 [Elysia crispata]|uniref:Uncharacterized protein n=1 Tax=Elysia crispata TaxID=231223 RepID=A0AAE1A8D7_9GAST|nr:hypothetical protein RRG08_046938 [Elysia crispata]